MSRNCVVPEGVVSWILPARSTMNRRSGFDGSEVTYTGLA